MNSTNTATTAKGSSTRDRILAAARETLIEQGITEFALREIADSLGIKLSNLQYYFPTRDALLLQVFADEAARDRAVISAHQASPKTAVETFRAIVAELITRWRGEGGVLYSTLGTLAIHSEEYRSLYRSIYSEFYEAIETPLQNIAPRLGKSELKMRARLITALIDGAPMQPRIRNRQSFLSRIQAEAETIAGVTNG